MKKLRKINPWKKRTFFLEKEDGKFTHINMLLWLPVYNMDGIQLEVQLGLFLQNLILKLLMFLLIKEI